MNNNLISVIIPVYNGEQYVAKAIESVLSQTIKNYEIILVDDGSTDSSCSICDSYAQKHDCIRVIHKKNGGISSARNAGINVATGEYISFLDSDDYVDSGFCAEIEKVITSFHPDCIDFGWRYISNGEIMPDKFHNLPKNVLLGERDLFDLILPPLLNLRNDPNNFVFDFSCTKIFKKEILMRNNVRFDENRRVWEDRPFVVNYLKYCSNYYSVDKCFYNYVNNAASLSHRYHKDFFRIIIENAQLYKELFGNNFDFDTEYVNNYWCHAIENMIFLSFDQKNDKQTILNNILKTLQDDQVIHWFSKRVPSTSAEKKSSILICDGLYEKALRFYKKEWRKRKMHNYNLKTIVKKVLGRL